DDRVHRLASLIQGRKRPRLRRVGIAGGAPAPLANLGRIGLAPPTIPARSGETWLRETGKHLEIRPFAKRLDAFVDLVRFTAVFASRGNYQLLNIGIATMWVTPRCKQAWLRVCARPKAQSTKKAVAVVFFARSRSF